MKNSRRKIAALIICLVAVIAIVSGSLAWYSSTNSVTQIASLAGFSTKADVYLADESGKESRIKQDENGLFILSANPEDDNFIGNLKIKVIHRGYANSYVRVKMSVQWTMPDGTVTQNVLLPFEFADKWYDNRENDYCVYYTEDTGLFESYDKSIITDFNSEMFAQKTMTKDAVAKLAVTVESVQVNRYQQIWGIEALPWK
ncbi:MAG: hypothetical protein IJZ57_10625 [Clostridia bacterium]|nr:hypothetical protein [Clostridia bacterium]